MAKAKSSKNFFYGFFDFLQLDSAIAYNRSNCGGGFVFVENFGIELDFESVDSQNFLQVRKMHPRTNCKTKQRRIQNLSQICQNRLYYIIIIFFLAF